MKRKVMLFGIIGFFVPPVLGDHVFCAVQRGRPLDDGLLVLSVCHVPILVNTWSSG